MASIPYLRRTQRVVLAIGLMCLCAAQMVAAQTQLWQQIPVPRNGRKSNTLCSNAAGHLFTCVVDEANNRTTVHRSRDNGETWEERGTASAMLYPKDVGPRGEILAIGLGYSGVYLSSDSGATWEQVLSGVVSDVDVSQMPSGRLFAGRPSSAGADSGLYTSDNNGETWTRQTGMPYAVSWDAMFFLADMRLYVVVEDSLFASANGGVTWTKLTGELDWHVVDLVDAGSGGMYGVSSTSRVYKSMDQGETWTRLGILGGAAELVLYGGAPVYAASDLGGESVTGCAYRSPDGGATWEPLGTGFHADDQGRQIHVTQTGRLYVEASRVSGANRIINWYRLDDATRVETRNVGVVRDAFHAVPRELAGILTVPTGGNRSVVSLLSPAGVLLRRVVSGGEHATVSFEGLARGTYIVSVETPNAAPVVHRWVVR